MRYFFRARHLLSAILLLVVSHSPLASLPDIIDKVRPGVVGVGTTYPSRQPVGKAVPSNLLGTGFVVGDGHIIVTNYHVLPKKLDEDNKQSLAVFSGRGKDARTHYAELLEQDPLHDLALLRITSGPLPALTLGDSGVVREGERIAFTGFPIGAILGLFPVTHMGIVSSITPIVRTADTAGQLTALQLQRMRNQYEVFQLDAIAYPGNSGSPVFLPDTGQVVGVINSVFVKESRETVLERPSGISYAIPVNHVKELLRRAQKGN